MRDEMSDGIHARNQTTRRDLLKKVGIGAGALMWSQPVIQAVTAGPAAAMTPFCDPPEVCPDLSITYQAHETARIVVDPGRNCGTCGDPSDVSVTFGASPAGTFTLVGPLTWDFRTSNCAQPRIYDITAEVTITCTDGPYTESSTWRIQFGNGCKDLIQNAKQSDTCSP